MEIEMGSHHFKWILLPVGGYCYGVEAGTGVVNRSVELHGGFKTLAEARSYKAALLDEFSDYSYAQVVRIETPNVPVEAPAERVYQGGTDGRRR